MADVDAGRERRSRMPKMLTAIGDKVRDASASRSRRLVWWLIDDYISDISLYSICSHSRKEQSPIPEGVEPRAAHHADDGAPPMGADVDVGPVPVKSSPTGSASKPGRKSVTLATKGSSVGRGDKEAAKKEADDDTYEVNQMIDQVHQLIVPRPIFYHVSPLVD